MTWWLSSKPRTRKAERKLAKKVGGWTPVGRFGYVWRPPIETGTCPYSTYGSCPTQGSYTRKFAIDTAAHQTATHPDTGPSRDQVGTKS